MRSKDNVHNYSGSESRSTSLIVEVVVYNGGPNIDWMEQVLFS